MYRNSYDWDEELLKYRLKKRKMQLVETLTTKLEYENEIKAIENILSDRK